MRARVYGSGYLEHFACEKTEYSRPSRNTREVTCMHPLSLCITVAQILNKILAIADIQDDLYASVDTHTTCITIAQCLSLRRMGSATVGGPARCAGAHVKASDREAHR